LPSFHPGAWSGEDEDFSGPGNSLHRKTALGNPTLAEPGKPDGERRAAVNHPAPARRGCRGSPSYALRHLLGAIWGGPQGLVVVESFRVPSGSLDGPGFTILWPCFNICFFSLLLFMHLDSRLKKKPRSRLGCHQPPSRRAAAGAARRRRRVRQFSDWSQHHRKPRRSSCPTVVELVGQ
jgi:hypothetical protein